MPGPMINPQDRQPPPEKLPEVNFPDGRLPEGITQFGLMALKHWAEFRPTMYRNLERKGKLIQAAIAAQNLTLEELYELEVGQKIPPNQAWEMVRENYILLPDEEDVPKLGSNPETWESPEIED